LSYNNTTNTNINPKSCTYDCGIQIYWNTSVNEYWEVFTQKKHICPNRSSNKPRTTTNTTAATVTKPTYYSKKPWSTITQPKPKMSNSFELLTGPIETIQKKYEILSDIVSEYNGKVHGSQSHIIAGNNSISLIVYYEVPEGKRDEVKRKYANSVITILNK
jgi:hypothetical protein